MPLFVCSKCNCIENTALSGYWCQTMDQTEGIIKQALCSECSTGHWHDEFEKTQFDGIYTSDFIEYYNAFQDFKKGFFATKENLLERVRYSRREKALNCLKNKE